MENRKKLHDYSLALIFLAVLDLFVYFANLATGVINGTINDALKTIEPNMVDAVKIVLLVVAVLMAILTLSEAFIGFKGLKVAREPNSDKGYITASKVLLVLCVIAFASQIVSLFGGNTDIVSEVFNIISVALDIVIFAIFIKVANSVRAEAIAFKQ